MFDNEEYWTDAVVDYINLAHGQGRKTTVGTLASDSNSPLWRCGGVKVMLKYVNRHLDKLALADTGRNRNGGLEVLVVGGTRSQGESASSSNASFNPLYCALCGINCSGAVDIAVHLKGAKHRSRALWAAVGDNDALLQDKGGLVVTCLERQSIVPGAVCIQGFNIKNSNQHHTTVMSVSELNCSESITITSAIPLPVMLDPGGTFCMQVAATSLNVGMLRTLIAVRCKDGTLVVRGLEVCVDTASDSSLPNLEPSAAFQKRARPSFTPAAEIVRAEKPTWALSNFAHPPGKYEVPHTLRALMHGSPEPSVGAVKRAVRALAGMPASSQHDSTQHADMLTGDRSTCTTLADHVKKMHALLYLEELQQETDIRFYDIEAAQLTRNHGQLLFLEVPGLAESRPSVMRGDSLFVRTSSSQPGSREWEGRVYEVQKEQVGLRFAPAFHSSIHVHGMPYHVRFKIARFTFRLMHEAASIMSKSRTAASALLPALAPIHGWSSFGRQGFPSPNPIKKWYKSELNIEQRAAVQSVLLGAHYPAPYIVFGPPGTGKTSVLVEAALQLLALAPSARLLLCAPSNSAADQLASRVLDVRPPSELMRINAFQRCEKGLPAVLMSSGICPSDGDGRFVLPTPAQITRPGVRCVITTCMMAIKLICQGVPAGHFTHLLIDEAGHAEEPLTLGPMATALGAHVVLAGDPKQLGPIVLSKVAAGFGLDTSLLERLTLDNTGPFVRSTQQGSVEKEGAYNPVYITKLVQNYRSHPDILSLPSLLFYDNELLAKADPMITGSMLGWEELPNKRFPIVFHAVVGEDAREGNSPSWFNVLEAKLVLEYIVKLKAKRGGQPVTDDDIGVITPYRKQVQRIRVLLAAKGGANIKVGSVEEFQGQERRIMIISTVRSSAQYIDFDKRFQLGFVANPKRFNVAITRAKAALVIIGNPSVLASDKHWRALLKYIQASEGCKGSNMPANLNDDTPEAAAEQGAEDLAARMDRLFLGGPVNLLPVAKEESVSEGPLVSVEGGEIPRWT